MKESYGQPRQHIKKQRHYFANKGPSSQGYGFSSSHVWMWELDYKESWAPKNWCFWTMVLEKTFESPLDCKVIQPVHPKGAQSWVFIERTDVEAETPIFCEELKMWRTDWERLKAGGEGDNRGWDGWMASLTHWTWVWVNSGVGDGQGGLACCSPWDRKDLYTTEWLNWTELKFVMFSYVYGLFLSGSHVLCSFVISMSVNYLFYLILPLFGVYILLFLTYKWFFKDWKYDYFVCDMYVFQYVFSLFTFFVSFFWASLVAQLVVIQFCM